MLFKLVDKAPSRPNTLEEPIAVHGITDDMGRKRANWRRFT